MKILHILDHYKPHFSGYVFRTSYILKHQKELGLKPVIVTSPKHGPVDEPVETRDGLTIYRTEKNNFSTIPFIREMLLMRELQKRIEQAIEIEKPDIIHAHSPSLNGIPALRAGRKTNIPVVYEVRAFWEDAAVDHGSFKEGSLLYRISQLIETYLLKRVDSVFTICNGLKTAMISRGIAENKITVIRNCVDAEAFVPQKYDEKLAVKHGLKGKMVLGFLGSFYYYEGIDILIESFSRVLERYSDIKLLLVGDGPAMEVVQEKVKTPALNGNVIITGKVPHAEVGRYYSLIDVLVYPRKKMRLTDLVTPLKPLEAMSMGKVVAGSNVGGIRELVTDQKDGYLFQSNSVQSLADTIAELYEKRDSFDDITRAARETVKKNHNWKDAVEKYLPVYNRIT